jgi:hypothetical protein
MCMNIKRLYGLVRFFLRRMFQLNLSADKQDLVVWESLKLQMRFIGATYVQR